MLAACCSLIVGLLTSAGALGYLFSKYSRLPRVELGTVLTEQSGSGEPRNILLVGVDSAAELDEGDPARRGRADVDALRSDTMMVLRLDPASGQASLLSLPRDLWVPLSSGGSQRINVAIERGGPRELIQTIEEYLGIPINHYVQLDFAGFRDLVAAIDGVEVPFAHPARDRRSGLFVEDAGCVTLSPDQALAYVRSREFQTFEDGAWRTDLSADLGRISRQQDFIVRSLRRAVTKGVRNPVTLDHLVDVALDTVTVDDVLTADDIIDLASRFRSFDPGELDLYSLPVEDDVVGGALVLRLRDRDAQPILDLFRGTDAEQLSPVDVRVRVLNGSGRPGEAGEVAADLAEHGFAAAGTGDAETFDVARTVVRHLPGQQAAADLVARHLVGGADLEEVAEGVGGDVLVVTGIDYTGVRDEPLPSGSTTVGEATTSTTRATTAPTTSTTVVGELPDPQETIDC